MPRLYANMSSELAFRACWKCFQGKWKRGDVLRHIEEWTGYSRMDLFRDEVRRGTPGYGIKHEILEECAMGLEDMVDEIQHGIGPDLDRVLTKSRRDGPSGKVREIAYLCMRHQLLGHITKLGMDPLLKARILPTQHASLPGKGQTGLKRQVQRFLRRRLDIRIAQKTDCTSAYASVQYDTVISLIRQEIPRARWILLCLQELKKAAPGGHLIIGGYLDAWLFNFVMSYAMRYVLGLRKSRRGNCFPLVIRAVTFMDDMLLLGRSETAMRQAVRALKSFFWERFRMTMRTTTAIFAPESGFIDMAGYRIRSEYVTMRRRNWRIARRHMIRALESIKNTGTLKRQLAGDIISRYGIICNSDSFRICRKYQIFKIMRTARKIQGYWSRADAKKEKERMQNAAHQHGVLCTA